MQKTTLFLFGGFLGAGKTTLMTATALRLSSQGKRVGLVTNDQAVNLVDTALLKQAGFAVNEVAGGCFCCRFDTLMATIESLRTESTPDFILCEAVGSCTDLSATVIQPWKQFFADDFQVAPLTVVVDPGRLLRLLKGDTSGNFPEEVFYIFRTQLEEADIIAINKADIYAPSLLSGLVKKLQAEFPGKAVRLLSARKGVGLDDWLTYALSAEDSGASLATVDYDTYAAGEAALAWLNARLGLTISSGKDLGRAAAEFFTRFTDAVQSSGGEAAHIKAVLHGEMGQLRMNLTESGQGIDVAGEPDGYVGDEKEAMLTVNLRAAGDPATCAQLLRTLADDVFTAAQVVVHVEEMESFRPAYPRPKHRFSEVV